MIEETQGNKPLRSRRPPGIRAAIDDLGREAAASRGSAGGPWRGPGLGASQAVGSCGFVLLSPASASLLPRACCKGKKPDTAYPPDERHLELGRRIAVNAEEEQGDDIVSDRQASEDWYQSKSELHSECINSLELTKGVESICDSARLNE